MKQSRLKRKTALSPDPEKVREFLQRGREKSGLKRTELKAKPRKARPPEGPLDPAMWRIRVMTLDGMRCRVTGARADDTDDPRFHCHHAIPKGRLRREGLHHVVWDERNGLLLTVDAHMNHEAAARRVAAEELPDRVFEFARELGTWAEDLVLRLHPPTDGGPNVVRGR